MELLTYKTVFPHKSNNSIEKLLPELNESNFLVGYFNKIPVVYCIKKNNTFYWYWFCTFILIVKDVKFYSSYSCIMQQVPTLNNFKIQKELEL